MKKKSVDLPNGETYYYIEKGQGDKVLLLLHGNMSSGLYYKPILNSFSNIKVIAPDMRGFGDSTYNNKIESIDDLSDDINLLLEELNIEKAIILGWSAGGAVALKFAAKYKKKTEKLILLESASYKGYPVYKKDVNNQPIIGEFYKSKEELAKDPVNVLPVLIALQNKDINMMKSIFDTVMYNVSKPTSEDNELYLKDTLKQRNLVDIDWALTNFNMSSESNGLRDGDNSIKSIDTEVLSIWSDKDIIVPKYMIDETVKGLNNVKEVILNNSGHSPLVDCPVQLVEVINNFIN